MPRSFLARFSPLALPAFAAALVTLAAPPAPARADEVYTFVVKKQEEKRKSNWSLQEWLDTRDRIRLMDLWLALHSPSPYEFFISGDFRPTNVTGGPAGYPASYSGLAFGAGAYASIFGLEVERDLGDAAGLPRTTGTFNLRVFGYHKQGTNITLHGGLRETPGAAEGGLRSALAGASITLYASRYFGLEGMARRIFPSAAAADGFAVSGARYEGTAFIDFSFVRVFGTYFSEPESRGGVEIQRQGTALGLRLFF